MSKITVEVTVDADLRTAWDCWTQPEHIVKWNFASDEWHCPAATNDPRTGVSFSATMAAKDGSMSFEFAGVYDEVIPLKKIAYTMGDGRKVDVLFEDLGTSTRVIETFDPENHNTLELQRTGWQAIMDNYRKHVENK
jgi:uncharacterized protein YndB with AHSA1/START domain